MSDNIQEITADELRKMDGKEGLVLQGCGGDLQDWLNGINELLTDAEILLNGSRFESASVFQHDGLTNLLFSFENVELNMGKLAMWRLQTHDQFGGTWLSDYMPNRLGGFVKETPAPQKPKMKLDGMDGNIYAVLGQASMLLNEAGMRDQIDEMFQRCEASGDYYKALHIISEYVETELSAPTAEHKKSTKFTHKKKGKTAHER